MEIKIPDKWKILKDIGEEEKKRRIWLLSHLCGGLLGLAIMLLLLAVFHLGAVDSTFAGFAGKTALDITDFKIGG